MAKRNDGRGRGPLRARVILFSLSLVAGGAAAYGEPPTDSGAELRRLFEQDKRDRLDGVRGDALRERDLARRLRLFEILEAESALDADALYHAAFLLQHSNPSHPDYTPDLYLLAHAFASAAAFDGHEDAPWLAAAALDRYLQFTGRRQFYGTQQEQDPSGSWRPGTGNDLLPPGVLSRFGLSAGER